MYEPEVEIELTDWRGLIGATIDAIPFQIERITNSTAYRVGSRLSQSNVDKMMHHSGWKVIIRRPAENSKLFDADNHDLTAKEEREDLLIILKALRLYKSKSHRTGVLRAAVWLNVITNDEWHYLTAQVNTGVAAPSLNRCYAP